MDLNSLDIYTYLDIELTKLIANTQLTPDRQIRHMNYMGIEHMRQILLAKNNIFYQQIF